MSDSNCWISFGQIPDPPAASGLCLLVPAWSDNTGGKITVRLGPTGKQISEVTHTGRFENDYKAGVVLVSDVDDLSAIGDLTGDLAEDVELARRVHHSIEDMLDCVSGGLYRLRPNGRWSEIAFSPYSETWLPGPPHLTFGYIVGHGDADSGSIGGCDADQLAEQLNMASMREAVLLVCSGGCPKIGEALSRAGRVIVACGTSVDVRAAYIFALNYLWKRFGDGTSPAQALGASNVVLPNDPYQLWYEQAQM